MNNSNRLRISLSKELIRFNNQHNAGEQTRIRIARGSTLNRISRIITQTTERGNAKDILDVERACEQLYLEHFATTPKEIESSQKTLQSMQSVKIALQSPLNPQQYKKDMRENLGRVNMSRITKAPQDIVHTFMRSQRQRLNKAAGQMASPPEKLYFQTRRDALHVALKIHEKNCKEALGLSRKKEHDH